MIKSNVKTKTKLVELLNKAHYKSSFRNNPSSIAVKISGQGSGNFIGSVIGALSTLGGPHGPTKDAAELLLSPDPIELCKAYLNAGIKIPGWGSSFNKGKPDPNWNSVSKHIEKNFTEIHFIIEKITNYIHSMGKMLYPNPACYTAATAIIHNIPSDASVYFFINARLSAWLDIYLNKEVK
jgi:citrate synthase